MRRIVLDTNCLLMCVSSKSPYHKVWTEFVEGKVAWCVSTEILSEYMEILEQKTNSWFAEVIVNAIVNNENTIRISPSFFFNLIQADPDDNKFVDCAVCGNAEYIVSNDSHFRILNDIDWPKLQLITIQEYVKEIDAHSGTDPL